MQFFRLAALAPVCLSHQGLAATVPPLKRDNHSASIIYGSESDFSSQTIISYPGQPQFTNATIRWQSYDAPTYDVAISPASEQDVVAAVNLMRTHNLSFLATGGRHGYGGSYGGLQDGVALDLSQMRQVTVDSAAQTVTVGPGIRFRDIYDPVWNAGFQVPTGTCSCVGMIGATLGAGIGRVQGVGGLMIDALESVRLATAAGEVLEVSETSNPELFWGVRGAGANLGIVTAATYRLSPRTTILSGDFVYPASMNQSYFETVAALDLPPEEAVLTLVVYNETVGEPLILSSITYVGANSTTAPSPSEIFAPFTSLSPLSSHITSIPWNRLSADSNFGLDPYNCALERPSNIHPVNLRAFDVPTMTRAFDRMVAFYTSTPALRGSVITLETWPNQAVRAVPDHATAYPWRDTETYVMIQMHWTDGDDASVAATAEAQANALRAEYVATSGYDDLAVYVNYAWGDETLEQVYGASKLPRLAALKKRYDPGNLFRFGVTLPMEYE